MTLRQTLTGHAMAAFLAMLVLSPSARAKPSGVVVPHYRDKYSAFVKQLEAGETDIDYAAFRRSFPESEQFKAAGEQKPDLNTLRQEMRELMQKSKFSEIIAVTEKMLSIDYTDMEAHKILSQTCKILEDIPKSKKHHDIEFGLLNSIIKKGNGKTCATAWPVVQINEEYFILQMLGARLLKQTMDTTGGACDKMDVQTDQGEKKTYFFEISNVFKGYHRKGIE